MRELTSSPIKDGQSKHRMLRLFVLAMAATWACSKTYGPGTPGETNQAGIAPSDIVITLQRSICAGGRCPAYEVTIRGDGKVTFIGSHIGETQISETEVAKLVDAFRTIGFFSLKDRYLLAEDGCSSIWTDNPEAKISIRLGAEYKSVEHYHGCEGVPILGTLTELENKIDVVAGTAQWLNE
jgi:hypothetical protein